MIWLERDVLLAVHEEQLHEHGGNAGIRDAGLLESAIARPRQHAIYVEGVAVADLAALYAIAIAHNHPFVDGNKRTALVALELFLDMNGYELTADNVACVQHILGIAAGEEPDEDFIVWVRQNVRRYEPK